MPTQPIHSVSSDDLARANRILIRSALILTMDDALGDFATADLLIEDGRIKAIGPELAIHSEDVLAIDASERIVIPGFVDTHCHSYQGLLRGLLPSGQVLPEYDEVIQKNLTGHYTAEDAYAGVTATALGMLTVGVTAMVDISQVTHTPEHIDAVLQALRDCGLRAVYAYSRGMGPNAGHPGAITSLLPKYFSSSDQLITPALAVSINPDDFRVARQAGVRAVLHIRLRSEPIYKLHCEGLLAEGDEFIHCTHLEPEAWRLIREAGGHTSHSPPLEMAMAHGTPSVQEAIDAGLSPSLSCDHCATVGQDMFGIMRTTFNLQRLMSSQKRRQGDAHAPKLLTPREVLRFATLSGAECAGLADKIGSLTPGKQADLVLLRSDAIDVWPINNAYSAVVNLMNPSHVDAVFVGGVARKWRGELVGVDLVARRAEIRRSRDAVLARGGVSPDLLG